MPHARPLAGRRTAEEGAAGEGDPICNYFFPPFATQALNASVWWAAY
jgi:hypothetical protein